MEIKGAGRLDVGGARIVFVEFTLTTGEGFAAGLGELRGDPAMLAAAFHAGDLVLHHDNWGDPLEVMMIGAPDRGVADFVPLGESPRYWRE